MSDNFISIFEAMPPLNVLCECKFEHFPNTKARLIQDIKNNRIIWVTQLKNSSATGSVPPVVAWRIIGTREEADEWFQQLPNFKEKSAEENVPSPFGNICTPSETK